MNETIFATEAEVHEATRVLLLMIARAVTVQDPEILLVTIGEIETRLETLNDQDFCFKAPLQVNDAELFLFGGVFEGSDKLCWHIYDYNSSCRLEQSEHWSHLGLSSGLSSSQMVALLRRIPD